MTQKQEKLQQLALALESRFGKDTLRTAKSLIEHNTLRVVNTGYPRLDHALGGGIPRDHLTEISGTATSGTRTLGIHLIVTTQKERQEAVYIDCGRTFSPDFATEQGVDCENLLLVRPDSCEQGLHIVRDLLMTRGVGLLVYDAGEYSPALRNTFDVLGAGINTALSGSGCALLCVVSNGRQVAPPLSAFAALRLHVEHVKWLRKLKDVTGYRVRVHILKNKQVAETESVEITLSIGGAK